MRSFIFYGLDLSDRILATETVNVEGIEAARRLARARLEEFPKVELWSEAVCVYRNRRAPEPPRAPGA